MSGLEADPYNRSMYVKSKRRETNRQFNDVEW